MTSRPDNAWWRGSVLYQIYPRSFADSNGDGVGDLRGIVERLDYLAWLGIDGIWLNPIMSSPDADWGYDVSDYCAVHPDFGELADLDELVAAAGERGIRVLLDLVPNHTSDRHPWFVEARSGRNSRRRDWYVWADPKPDGSPPNNWRSYFEQGPAWTLDETSGQYYLHNFLAEQPDLNWWNDEVRQAFDEILRFWFARGIAGFRIDVAHVIVKDAELRDNPPLEADDPWYLRRVGQKRVYNFMRPELHDVLRRWRVLADAQEPRRVLIGEGVIDVEHVAAFYGTGEDELHMTFNFSLTHAPFEAEALRDVVEESEDLLPERAWPLWTLGNHDIVRYPTRWGLDDARSRCALTALLALRGTPVLYYGDELALPSAAIPKTLQDPVGRDPERTPMHWSPEPGAGFTGPAASPWLPLGDHGRRNVASQRDDPESSLTLCRDLIALRRRNPDLRSGSYASLPAPPDVWAWRRGENVTVALNLSDAKATVEGIDGAMALCTERERDGEDVDGLELAPWEGAVVEGRSG